MKTKVLFSIIIIGVVSSIGFVSTRALFSDSITKSGSSFTIGTLDLDISGEDGKSVSINNIGTTAELNGEKSWVVNNKGSITGRLYIKIANLKNLENGCNEPESIVDSTCGSADKGELGDTLIVKFYVDGVEKASINLSNGSDLKLKQMWESAPAIIVESGKSVDVKMSWSANENDYGNEIQSDSLSFDIVFDLVQLVSP